MGIGRATAIAAAANGLTAVGLDVNEAECEKTVEMVHEMGGEDGLYQDRSHTR